MSFYGQPVSSGPEVIEYHRARRAKRAELLRLERQRIKKLFAECPSLVDKVKLANHIVQDNVKQQGYPKRWTPFKPTAENFRTAATERYHYGFSTWSNPYDTEYYSACGYDDYQGELRNAAKAQAIEYFRAWKTLTGK